MQNDYLEIHGLSAATQIGVPDAERKEWQTVLVDAEITPVDQDFCRTGDTLSSTVDYAALSSALRSEAASKPRLLIETLADDLAQRTLAEFQVDHVRLRVRKFVLPGTAYVGVTVFRRRNESSAITSTLSA